MSFARRAHIHARERVTLSSPARNVNGYLRDSYCGDPLWYNYGDENGCERCVFSWDPTSGRREAAEDGGTERRGEERSYRRILSANASPPSRTHSWLSINIVVDSTLARSFIELSFRSDEQTAWAGSLSLSPVTFLLLSLFLSPSPFLSRGMLILRTWTPMILPLARTSSFI